MSGVVGGIKHKIVSLEASPWSSGNAVICHVVCHLSRDPHSDGGLPMHAQSYLVTRLPVLVGYSPCKSNNSKRVV